MGPFTPGTDGFPFRNSFDLTAAHAEEFVRMFRDEGLQPIIPGISARYTDVLANLSFDLTPLIPGGRVGLPDALVGQVGFRIGTELTALAVDSLLDPFGGGIGHCGGMAFGGYDFYQQGWPVDRFGTTPPTEGELGEYIYARLIESLELNLRKFLRWFIELHLLPRLNIVATAVLGTAAGSLGGPLGAAVGIWLASIGQVFNFGGSRTLLDWTKEEWGILKSRLDRQSAWPIGLVYGDTKNPFDMHQVLAIGYEDTGPGTAFLQIWNNNEVRRSNRLRLDFRGESLQVENFNDPNGHVIKGIFAEEYGRRKPPDSLNMN